MVKLDSLLHHRFYSCLPSLYPVSSEDRVYFLPDGAYVSFSKVYEKLWIFDMGAYDIEEGVKYEVLW